eukprot:6463038-Amphidinium_carterae.1
MEAWCKKLNGNSAQKLAAFLSPIPQTCAQSGIKCNLNGSCAPCSAKPVEENALACFSHTSRLPSLSRLPV